MEKADYYRFISGGTKSLINSWFPAIFDREQRGATYLPDQMCSLPGFDWCTSQSSAEAFEEAESCWSSEHNV